MANKNKYKNASALLPKELLTEVQKFFSGGTLYIPASSDEKTLWGEKSGARSEYSARNRSIKELYCAGKSPKAIADTFCISVDAVKKILYSK